MVHVGSPAGAPLDSMAAPRDDVTATRPATAPWPSGAAVDLNTWTPGLARYATFCSKFSVMCTPVVGSVIVTIG